MKYSFRMQVHMPTCNCSGPLPDHPALSEYRRYRYVILHDAKVRFHLKCLGVNQLYENSYNFSGTHCFLNRLCQD